jgi:hypothetical protein
VIRLTQPTTWWQKTGQLGTGTVASLVMPPTMLLGLFIAGNSDSNHQIPHSYDGKSGWIRDSDVNEEHNTPRSRVIQLGGPAFV